MEQTQPAHSYTFAYPTRVVGGGEYLIIRLATHLSKLGYAVNVIDYPDGFIARELRRTAPEVNHVAYYDDSVPVPEDTLLIIPPLLHVPVSKWKVPYSSRVIVLCCDKLHFSLRFGPLDFSPPLNFAKLREEAKAMNLRKYQAFKSALHTMAKHHGVMFLEPYAKEGNAELFEVDFDPAYSWMTPTPCTPTTLPKLVNRWNSCHHSQELHLGWLGRLSFEKIACLKFLIHNAACHANPNQKITIHIIGEGDETAMLRNWIKEKKFTEDLTIRWVGTLTGSELDYYMKSSVDACFAHGTSLLESAKLKLPSIITDSSLDDIPLETPMAYLHESAHGILGEFVNSNITPRNNIFASILNEIRTNKAALGEKAYQYWQDNHSIDATASAIIDQANRCTYSGRIFEQCNTFLPQEGRALPVATATL